MRCWEPCTFRKKALDRGIAEFEAGAKLNPGNAASGPHWEVSYSDRGQTDRAQQAYEKALQIDPISPWPPTTWHGCCVRRGAIWTARSIWRGASKWRCLRRRPSPIPRGWIYYQRRLYGLAIPVLQGAVRAEPGNAEYRPHLAASLWQEGKKPQARSELQAALKLDESWRRRSEVQQILGTPVGPAASAGHRAFAKGKTKQ